MEWKLKKLFVLILFLGISGFFIYADGMLRWSWYSQDEEVSWFRYQLNAEDADGWTVVDATVTSVMLPTSNATTLYVQSSYDGVHWSASGSATYVEEKGDFAFSVKTALYPYSVSLYRFYNGYETSSTRTKTNSEYGLGSSVEFDFAVLPWLTLYPEIGYNLAIKAETVIPGQRDVHYLKAGAGVDFTFNINNSTISAGLFGGAMAHINNKKASITPYFGSRIGYEYAITNHLSLGAQSKVTFALFNGSAQTLMHSMTILIDPVGFTLAYKF